MTTTTVVRTPAPGWYRSAACDGLGDLMFPNPRDRVGENAARRVCGVCPVAGDCLADSLQTGEFEGIRAGFNGRERERMAAGQRPRRCRACRRWFVPFWAHQVRCHGDCSPGVTSC